MAFDEKCKELAQHFLEGEDVKENDVDELAQVIQDRIEAWLDARKDVRWKRWNKLS